MIDSKLRIEDLGFVEYSSAWEFQKKIVQAVAAGGPATLILCEHPAVLTLGRLAKPEYILASENELKEKGIRIIRIDRGGEVTLHAPGQLVVYPILRLAGHGQDLRIYLERLEQVAIDLLNDFGIVAGGFPGQRGVWVGSRKIVSIGIGVKKWVSFHGLAINVNTDLALFQVIRPCGLLVEMTSMAQEKCGAIDMDEVKTSFLHKFQKHFFPSPIHE